MNTYEIDTLVQLNAAFADRSGAPADPTDVNLFVKDPTGTVTQYTFSGSQVQHNGTGNFFYNFLAGRSGTYTYKFQGTGAVQVTCPDQQFSVNRSALIPG